MEFRHSRYSTRARHSRNQNILPLTVQFGRQQTNSVRVLITSGVMLYGTPLMGVFYASPATRAPLTTSEASPQTDELYIVPFT